MIINKTIYIYIEKIEEIFLINTIGYMKIKSQFYGLGKKLNARNNGFVFIEIVKKMIQIYQF